MGVGQQTWETRRREKPDQPWLWRDDWSEGKVVWKALGVRSVWTMAITFNLILGIAALATPGDQIRGASAAAKVALALLLFGGLVLFAWAVRRSLRGPAFGRFALELETVPAAPGGQLRGSIEAFCGGPPRGGFDVRLTCLRTKVVRNPGSPSSRVGSATTRLTHSTPLWQSAYNTPARPNHSSRDAVGIPVHFDLPEDVAETSRDLAAPYDSLARERDGSISVARSLRAMSGLPPLGTEWIHWQLAVQGAVPTELSTCVFDVPVFAAPAEASTRTRSRSFEARPPSYSAVADLRFEPVASGGSQVAFPRRTNLGVALVCCLAAAAGASLLGWLSPGAREGAFMVGLVAVVFAGLFGAAVLRSVSRIQIREDRLDVSLGFWGLRRTKRFQRDQIAAIEADGMFGEREAATYALVLRSLDGTSFRFDSTLASEAEVEILLQEIRTRAELPSVERDSRER